MRGIISNTEKVEAFLFPLSEILKVGISRILLEIYQQKKSISINTRTSNGTNYVFVEYKNLFSDFQFSQDIQFGIYNLSSFCSVIKLIENNLLLDIKSNEAILSNGSNYRVVFLPCLPKDTFYVDRQNIDISKSIYNNYFCEFVWDETFKKFSQSFNIFSGDHFILIGEKDKNVVYLILTNKNLNKSNSIHFTITPKYIGKDFKIILEKEKVYSIIANIRQDVKVIIKEKTVNFYFEHEYYNLLHSVCALVK